MNANLHDRLRDERTHRVIPLVGPADSGKTRAVAEAGVGFKAPFAHVRVRAYHATLVPFVRALVDELTGSAPLLGAGMSAAVTAARRSPNAATYLGDWFAERIGTEPRIVALDDLHEIAPADALDDAVRDFMVRAVAASHRNVRYVLAGRDTIAWPMALWLADSTACVAVSFGNDPSQRDRSAREGERFVEWLHELDANDALALRALALLPSLDGRYVARIAHAFPLVRTLTSRFPTARSGDRFTSTSCAAIAAAWPGSEEPASALACDAMEQAAAPVRLSFYIERDARTRIVKALDCDGFDMLEGEHGDVVHEALERLNAEERRSSALAVFLEAKREMELGRHDVGESWYLHAASIAGSPQARAWIERAHGADLLRRSRSDAIEVLERVVQCPVSPWFDALATATLGGAYATNERLDEARATMQRALAAIRTWGRYDHVSIRAIIYRQAAYVFLRVDEPASAAVFGRRAIEAARRCGSDEIVASALSVLVVVANSHEDDGEAAIELLQQLERCAERLEDAFLLRYSRLALLDAYGEAANWREVDRIEALLSSQELENDVRHADETLVRIRALRFAASGNFASAARLLHAAIDQESEPDLVGLRHAELAAYAAAAGDPVAREAIAAADGAIQELAADNALVVRTLILLALAEFLSGDPAAAQRRTLLVTSASARFPRMRALYETVNRIIAHDPRSAAVDDMAIIEALCSLHACGLGGIAAVLGALPLSRVLREAS